MLYADAAQRDPQVAWQPLLDVAVQAGVALIVERAVHLAYRQPLGAGVGAQLSL